MKLIACFLIAFATLLAPLQAQVAKTFLLGSEFEWQKQSGDWTADGATVSAKATDRISEYAATTGIALKNHWLSLRIAVAGGDTKAGIWLAGLRDEKGDLVRLTLEAASGIITNGRGKTIATIPNGITDAPTDLVLKFTDSKLTLFAAGLQIAEFNVVFEDAKTTPSLFVERGRATFSDIVLGSEAKKPTITKAAPVARPVPPPKVVVSAGFSVDFSPEKMTALKGTWRDYFGVHTETAPGPWKTVRQFDGPASSLPLKSKTPGKKLDGPFNQAPVEMDLSWFRDPLKPTALGLDKNIASIVRADIDAVFIAPWKSMIGKIQQDEIWALMKLAYGTEVGAEKRLIFQWGDDINAQSLGTNPDVRSITAQPRHGIALRRDANSEADAKAYAENYFAPAVEAVRLASNDVFHDERRIPVMVGSCARAGASANRDWFRSVLDRELESTLAPSLKGKKVIDLVDYLTVNYPFADALDTKGLQALWNAYGKQVKGLWITEEFGTPGRGPVNVMSRIGLFFEWVAANNLDAQQTRMIWNFPAWKRPTDDSSSLFLKLAESMNGEIRFGSEAKDAGTIYRISSGENRLLMIFVPSTDRRGIRPQPVGEIAVELGKKLAAKPWVARVIQSTGRRNPNDVLPVRTEDSRVFFTPTATTASGWSVMLELP